MVKLLMNPLGEVQGSTSSPATLPKKQKELLIVHDASISAMDVERLQRYGRRILFRRCVFGPSCQRALDALAALSFRCDTCRGLDLVALALSVRTGS